MWCCTRCHEASSLANLWQTRTDRGPHDLRHTFATWLEDASIPSRVIDKLMGHTGGRRHGGASGSPMDRIYRETTPAMLARVTAAPDERIGRAMGVAGSPLRDAGDRQELRLDKL
jgi:integrase